MYLCCLLAVFLLIIVFIVGFLSFNCILPVFNFYLYGFILFLACELLWGGNFATKGRVSNFINKWINK